MRYLDEYRDPDAAKRYVEAIHHIVTREWTIMEICGGQTHTIVKYGVDELLPPQVSLLHGPGCPVCVTPMEIIDQALELAARPDVIFTSFGDMLRVPGSQTNLLSVKAQGGDVRIVYSPLDALAIARQNPGKQVIFFAVGFETTAPANAMAVYQAHRQGIANFSILVSHVLVPPAIELILSSPDCRVNAFLAAGHVCTVMGYHEYVPLAQKYGVPFVVTGFEPLDILQGVYMAVKQLEEGRAEVENQYSRSVRYEGNVPAQDLIQQVFQVSHQTWRGMGEIPKSGLALRPPYETYDAETRFKLNENSSGGTRHGVPQLADSVCIGGLVLQGIKKPHECPVFGTLCTPEHPLGAMMVSNEGACAAYYRYRAPIAERQNLHGR